MKLFLQIVIFISVTHFYLAGQTSNFGINAGPSLGLQKWSYSNSPLFAWHADFYMDSKSTDGNNAIYGMLGYHINGGAIRYSRYVINGVVYNRRNFGMRFYNLTAEVGMKKYINKNEYRAYYCVGLHGAYTMKTQFDFNEGLKEFVKPLTAGFSLHAGIDIPISKFKNAGIDLRIAPDFTKQVFQPAGLQWYDPFSGSYISGQEQSIRNFQFELSFVFRFTRYVVYDE